MRPVLVAVLAALTTALAAIAPGASAQTLDVRLSAEDIRDIARRELLWCEEYQASTDDCDVVTLVRLLPDGAVVGTSTLLVSEGPNLQVYISDTDRIVGDRLCSKINVEETRFHFTIDGQPASGTAALSLRLLFAAQMEEFDGKTVCQAFFRGDDPDVIREEITVDDERRTDLESTYHLREGSTALKLRPQVSEDDKNAQVQI